MKTVTQIILLVAIASLSITASGQSLPVIEKLSDSFHGDSALLRLRSGKTIIVLQTEEKVADTLMDNKATEKDFISADLMAPPPIYPKANKDEECKSEVFQGTHRAKSKTTMLSTEKYDYKKFNTVKDAISFLKALGSESEIGNGLSTHSDDPRAQVELYNIWIKKAYLYQVYREPDNDFHMIIGDGGAYSKQLPQMNVEVSGLPRDDRSQAEVARFKQVRQRVKDSVIGDLACVTRTMEKNPIALKNVKGSIFLDKSHIGDEIGRGNIKVSSSWEIHPVSDITITETPFE